MQYQCVAIQIKAIESHFPMVCRRNSFFIITPQILILKRLQYLYLILAFTGSEMSQDTYWVKQVLFHHLIKFLIDFIVFLLCSWSQHKLLQK